MRNHELVRELDDEERKHLRWYVGQRLTREKNQRKKRWVDMNDVLKVKKPFDKGTLSRAGAGKDAALQPKLLGAFCKEFFGGDEDAMVDEARREYLLKFPERLPEAPMLRTVEGWEHAVLEARRQNKWIPEERWEKLGRIRQSSGYPIPLTHDWITGALVLYGNHT